MPEQPTTNPTPSLPIEEILASVDWERGAGPTGNGY